MPQTVLSNLFSGSLATTLPAHLIGVNIVPFTRTVVDADVDEIGDITKLCPVPQGAVPIAVYLENATDLDSGTNTLRTDLDLFDNANSPTVLLADSTGYFNAVHGTGAGQWFLLNTTPKGTAAPDNA